jgi:hypothetical protein
MRTGRPVAKRRTVVQVAGIPEGYKTVQALALCTASGWVQSTGRVTRKGDPAKRQEVALWRVRLDRLRDETRPRCMTTRWIWPALVMRAMIREIFGTALKDRWANYKYSLRCDVVIS